MNERTKRKENAKKIEFDANQMISQQKLHRKSNKPHDTPTKRRLLVHKIYSSIEYQETNKKKYNSV